MVNREGFRHERIDASRHRDRGEPRARRTDRARPRQPRVRPGDRRPDSRSAARGRRTNPPERAQRDAGCRRHHGSIGAGAPRERRPRARRPGSARQQRVRARSDRPADRIRGDPFRTPVSSERRRADRADSAGGAAAGRTHRTDRERDERRRAGRVSRMGTLRRHQGGAGAVDADARGGAPRARRLRGRRRSGRHADAHASGSLSRRGHLRSAAAGRDGPVLELAVRSAARGRQRRAVRGPAGGRAMAAPGVMAEFELPPDLEAAEPPEARGLRRDQVRLLVSDVATDAIEHARFSDLPRWFSAGDLLVVNASGTLNAAVAARSEDGEPFEIHLSTRLPGGFWTVEVRRPGDAASLPYDRAPAGMTYRLPADGIVTLLAPYPLTGSIQARSRLWIAALQLPDAVVPYLETHGAPIRYGYVKGSWPSSMYQTVFATEPGSAEMPSAGRPFTPELVTTLVSRGV